MKIRVHSKYNSGEGCCLLYTTMLAELGETHTNHKRQTPKYRQPVT